MGKMIPKPRVYRDEAYLAFIRAHPCLKCGRGAPVEAHHEPMGRTGMGIKPPDYHAVPLCSACHQRRHQQGPREFWGHFDIRRACMDLMAKYIAQAVQNPAARAVRRLRLRAGDILVVTSPRRMSDAEINVIGAQLNQALSMARIQGVQTLIMDQGQGMVIVSKDQD